MFNFPRKPASTLSRAFLAGSLAACGLCFPLAAAAVTSNAPITAVQRSDDAPPLDVHRMFALGMIESGNDDRAIGSAGEVSRYQLSPSVWKTYSKSLDYQNPEVSLQVARQHWNYLAAYFKEKTSHTPDDFDCTSCGTPASGTMRARISPAASSLLLSRTAPNGSSTSSIARIDVIPNF